jgi:hypothetical protein
MVYAAAYEARYLNGRSLGVKEVPHGLQPVVRWEVPNEPDSVRVVGIRELREAGPLRIEYGGTSPSSGSGSRPHPAFDQCGRPLAH